MAPARAYGAGANFTPVAPELIVHAAPGGNAL